VSELEAQEFTADEPLKPEREGLPPGYRMRADPHYVDLLASGERGERARDSRPAVRDVETPAVAVAPRVPRDRRLVDQLLEDVTAIESAAALLASGASPLARRVSLDLIKAQSARAAWLLRAQGLLNGQAPELLPRAVPVAGVLAQLRSRLACECRLVGVALQAATESPAVVAIDEGTLSLGVTGAVLSLLPIVSGTEGAAIRIDAIVEEDGDDDDLQAVEISQDLAPLSAQSRQRFFDADWIERPGGWLAATGAAVAFAAAERLGGRAVLQTGPRRGCSIRLSFA
jgi:hypothetical protein